MKQICIDCLKNNPDINCIECKKTDKIYDDFCHKPSLNKFCHGQLCSDCPKK